MTEIDSLIPTYGVSNSFDEIYGMLLEYKREYGNLNIPLTHVTSKGAKLGALVKSIRYGSKQITSEQKELLDNIGFLWHVKHKRKVIFTFEEFYMMLIKYKKEYGNLNIDKDYVTPNDEKLGEIVAKTRVRRDKLCMEQIELLDSIGFIWNIKRIRRRTKIKAGEK